MDDSNRFRKGEKVEWDSPQGTVEGTVEKKLTSPTVIKGHTSQASPDNPRYLVRSDRSGRLAAHRAEELRRRNSNEEGRP